jgi:signal transduction histidine kinase
MNKLVVYNGFATTASHGEDMLRDLLELLRVTSVLETPVEIELHGVVSDAIEGLRALAQGRGIDLTVAALPRVKGQPKKLRHAFTNLIGNAIKYVEVGTGHVHVDATSDGNSVVIRIRDDGIGIPLQYHSRIFDLFTRVPGQPPSEDGGGTGVGLALVKRIVDDHHGEVWVESTTGRGSCFYVRLPHGS